MLRMTTYQRSFLREQKQSVICSLLLVSGSFSCSRRIFADVTVNSFPHQHTANLIEAEAENTNKIQKLKKLIKLSNLRNVQLFASNIEGRISHQKLRNRWVARILMSHIHFFVKFRVFKRNFLRSHSVYS